MRLTEQEIALLKERTKEVLERKYKEGFFDMDDWEVLMQLRSLRDKAITGEQINDLAMYASEVRQAARKRMKREEVIA